MTTQETIDLETAADHPRCRLSYRRSVPLTGQQRLNRQRVLDRISYEGPGVWRWTGQSKIARHGRYPQILHRVEDGLMQLVNARHVVFYLATGWVAPDVQQYRAKDGDPMNVHPDNLAPLPPIRQRRRTTTFWSFERLRSYYG